MRPRKKPNPVAKALLQLKQFKGRRTRLKGTSRAERKRAAKKEISSCIESN